MLLVTGLAAHVSVLRWGEMESVLSQWYEMELEMVGEGTLPQGIPGFEQVESVKQNNRSLAMR